MHQVIQFGKPRGLWYRARSEVYSPTVYPRIDQAPLDYQTEAFDVVFRDDSIETRPGIAQSTDCSSFIAVGQTIVQIAFYRKSDGTNRLLVLDSTGKLWDPAFSTVTPILNIAAMTAFSLATLYDRAYISPHNKSTGLQSQYVYVYDTTAVCRAIGGTAPAAYVLAPVNSAVAGNVEAGIHLVNVAFETASGFVTKMGALAVQYTATGGFCLRVTGVPTGPAGTTARYILATKVIAAYNGNYLDYEFFFVPGGRIADNVTTVIDSLNFFDSDLISSADHLFDQLETVPAALNLSNAEGRLTTCGEYANPSIVRVSKGAAPEAFSSIDGFIVVDPGDVGGTVTNVVENRGTWYITKRERLYSTFDNGNVPALWKLNLIDSAVGAPVFGVSRVDDTKGPTSDLFLVADRSGLRAFGGGSSAIELSYPIEYLWRSTFNSTSTQVLIDSFNKRIYVRALDSTILVGDYNNGLTPEGIRWAQWSNFQGFMAIATQTDNTIWLYIGGFPGSQRRVHVIDGTATSEVGGAIPSTFATAMARASNDGAIGHFSEIRYKADINGYLSFITYGINKSYTTSPPEQIGEGTPPSGERRRLINHINEGCMVRFGLLNAVATHRFAVQNIRLYAKRLWGARYGG